MTSKFDDKFLTAIKSELEEQTNVLLKARYNDLSYILTGEIKHGKNAVSGYLEIAQIYQERDLDIEKRSNGDGLAVSRFLSRAYALSVQTEHQRESVKQTLMQTLSSFNKNSSSKNRLSADLISILITHEGSLLKKEDVHFLISICKERAALLLKENNSSFAEAFWGMQSTLEQLINIEREEFYWENARADLYLSDSEKERTSLAKIIQLEKALKIYFATGNKQKISLVQDLIQKEAPNVELQQSSFEIDMQPIVELAKKSARSLSKEFSGIELLIYLSNLEAIIADNIDEDEVTASVFDLISSVHILDEQNQLAGEPLSDKQKEQKKKFDNYSFTLDQIAFYYKHLIRDLLVGEHIKENDIIEFMNRSWVKSKFRNNFFGSNYSKAMDCDLTQTKEGKTKKNRRTLHTFLMSEQTRKIRKKIIKSKKERFFINFVMLDIMPPFELSLNLRNRISHTRHTPNNYSFENLVLLFLITLRIMRTDLPENR